MEKTKLIIDCDAGIDDMQAIMLALSRQEAEVLAITCVNGNTNMDNVCRNVLRVLSVCNRMDVNTNYLLISIDSSEFLNDWSIDWLGITLYF